MPYLLKIHEKPATTEIAKYIPSSDTLRHKNIHAQILNDMKSSKPSPQYIKSTSNLTISTLKPNNDLLQFIEKQEGYIDQLERESQFCRGELSNILNKVKDVISENEVLTEQTKLGTIVSDTSDSGSNDFNYKNVSKQRSNNMKQLSGPNIVFESRISELEAQLTQAEIDIKKLTQENNLHKEKLETGENVSINNPATFEVYKRELQRLQW